MRLLARGVQPLHCLILRGRDATVVRRWGPDTRLNGQAFSDARLSPGDRLTIGPIELEVLQTTASTPPTQVAQYLTLPDFPKTAILTARLALANRQGRRRTRAVVERLRAAQHEVARLEARWTAERQEQQQKEREHEALSGRLASLENERKSLEEHCRAREAQCEALERDHEAWKTQSAEIEVNRAQLDAQRREWEQERIRWNAEREEEQRQMEHRRAELDAAQSRLQAETRRPRATPTGA